MKSIFARTVLLSYLLISMTGCYTVVWEPDMEFPDEYNSEMSYDNYYTDNYFGNYDYFYNYPWWLSVSPPTKERINNRDNTTTNTLRNGGEGRISTGERNPGQVINTPPPTRDSNNGNTTSSEGSNSGNTGGTIKTDTNRSNNTGNSSNPVRNNDGNRTTDGKKR